MGGSQLEHNPPNITALYAIERLKDGGLSIGPPQCRSQNCEARFGVLLESAPKLNPEHCCIELRRIVPVCRMHKHILYTYKNYPNLNDTFKRVICILVNCLISTRVFLTRIACTILVKIPSLKCDNLLGYK